MPSRLCCCIGVKLAGSINSTRKLGSEYSLQLIVSAKQKLVIKLEQTLPNVYLDLYASAYVMFVLGCRAETVARKFACYS